MTPGHYTLGRDDPQVHYTLGWSDPLQVEVTPPRCSYSLSQEAGLGKSYDVRLRFLLQIRVQAVTRLE